MWKFFDAIRCNLWSDGVNAAVNNARRGWNRLLRSVCGCAEETRHCAEIRTTHYHLWLARFLTQRWYSAMLFSHALLLSTAEMSNWVTGWVIFLSFFFQKNKKTSIFSYMQLLRIYKRPKLLTLHVSSMCLGDRVGDFFVIFFQRTSCTEDPSDEWSPYLFVLLITSVYIKVVNVFVCVIFGP